MFKLESYVTPLILSYVDKYIKNLKPEDSQLSLWDGDASFCNLDLRLDVLEHELNLPFTLVNGHIHELRIHVPWIKLVSEPVVITINTIECILKLRSESQLSSNVNQSSQTGSSRKFQKKPELQEAPPGYVQSIINRALSNICIVCNNLILKYVEDDIVLSLNIKSAELFNVDEKWERAFVDITQPEAIMRRVVKMQDLTVCLDKRDASGKIEAYQDPLLYRCSTVWRIYSTYDFTHSKHPLVTRINMLCDKLDFSLTDQQLPMFMRLMHLCYLLQYKETYLSRGETTPEDGAVSKKGVTEEIDTEGEELKDESWTSWMLSFIPEIPTLVPEDGSSGEETDRERAQKVFQMGIFIDKASCVFKTTSFQDACYGSAKYVVSPFAVLDLYGCSMECTGRGPSFFNVQMGITGSTITELDKCACGATSDLLDKTKLEKPFFRAGIPPGGSDTYNFLSSSLFDPLAPENCGQNRKYCFDQELHLSQLTEDVLVKRFPTFAFDYIYELQIPEDWLDKASLVTSTFLEDSNWKENSVCRLVIGPFCADINSSMVHFFSKLFKCAKTYESPPYMTSEPTKAGSDTSEVTSEDVQSAKEHVPLRTYSLTLLKPVLRLYPADHLNYDYGKSERKKLRKSLRKHEKIKQTSTTQIRQFLVLQLATNCVDMKLSYAMYPNRIARIISTLESPPEDLLDYCYSNFSLKLFGCEATLMKNIAHRGGRKYQRQIVPSTCATFSRKTLRQPQFWKSRSDFVLQVIKAECNQTIIEIGEEEFLFGLCLYQSWMMNGFEESKQFETFFHGAVDKVRISLSLETYGLNFQCTETAESTSCNGTVSTLCLKLQNTGTGSSTVLLKAPEPTLQAHNWMKFFKEKYDTARSNTTWLTFSAQMPRNLSKEPYELLMTVGGIAVCLEPALLTWWRHDPVQIFEANIIKPSSKINDSELTDDSPCVSSQLTIPSESQSLSQSLTFSADTWLQTNMESFLVDYLCILQHLHVMVELESMVVLFPNDQWSVAKTFNEKSALKSWQNAVDQHHLTSGCLLCFPKLSLENSNSQNMNDQVLGNKHVSLNVAIPKKDKEFSHCFSWTLNVTDLSLYTISNQNFHFVLNPCGLSATFAVTSKSNQNQLAFCVHVDTTAIIFSYSAAQVHLAVECLNMTFSCIKFAQLVKHWVTLFCRRRALLSSSLVNETKTITVGKSNPCKNERSTENNEKGETEVGESSAYQTCAASIITEPQRRVSVWVQLTLPKISINFYGKFITSSVDDRFHFQFLAEEVITSLDVQNVYTKAKVKISSLNMNIFTRSKNDEDWSLGPQNGVVLCCDDKIRRNMRCTVSNNTANPGTHRSNQKALNQPFLLLQCTKALCRNAKQKWIKGEEISGKEMNSGSQYIREVDMEVRQFDVIVWMSLLKAVVDACVPLQYLTFLRPAPPNFSNFSGKPIGMNFSNKTLPMLYIKASTVRLFLPSMQFPINDTEVTEAMGASTKMQKVKPDMFVFCLDSLNLMSQVENPLSRIIVEPELYASALASKSIFIPGSDIEDRQYQLDVYGLCFGSVVRACITNISCTSKKESISAQLPIMGENPALEWNIGVINESRNQQNQEPLLVVPIISSFDARIAVAPAIISNSLSGCEDIVISGITLEISIANDILLYLSPRQIELLSIVVRNIANLLLLPSSVGNEKLLKVKGPETLPFETISRDSGIDSELSLLLPHSPISTEPLVKAESIKSFVPFEALVTAGSISLILFIHESDLIPVKQKHTAYAEAKKKHSLSALHSNLKCTLHRKSAFSPCTFAEKLKKTLLEYQEDGYEGSSDSSESEDLPPRKKSSQLHPVLCISISQPHTFLKCHPTSQRFEVSCFDLHVKGPCPCHLIVETENKLVPSENDYPLLYLETKPGEANNKTGIPPALCTVTLLEFLSDLAKASLLIERPVKFKVNSYLWDQCETFIKSLIRRLDTAFLQQKRNEENSSSTANTGIDTYARSENQFWKLLQLRTVEFSTEQVLLQLDLIDCSNPSSLVTSVNSSKLGLEFEFLENGDLQSVKTSAAVSGYIVNVGTTSTMWPLLLPTSFEFSIDYQLLPFLQVKAYMSGDAIIVNLSLSQVLSFSNAVNEVRWFFEHRIAHFNQPESLVVERSPSIVKSWHDDLRNGSFSFIKAPDGQNVQPRTNEIVFSRAQTNQPATMTWRYPEPRILTKIEVSPVPFRCEDSEEPVPDIHCIVQSWDSLNQEFIKRCEFDLSETRHCSPDFLPADNASITFSEVWQVVMESNKTTSNDAKLNPASVSPLPLAACMCIDSCFDPDCVPSSQAIAQFPLMKLNFFYNLPDSRAVSNLLPFLLDGTLPNSHNFFHLSGENIALQCVKWNSGVQVQGFADITSEILEYRSLTMLPICDSMGIDVKATVFYEANKTPVIEVEGTVQPAVVRITQSILHTLNYAVHYIASELSENVDETTSYQENIPPNYYMICNNTNEIICFGQSATDESLILHPQKVHAYSWRSHKAKQMLQIFLQNEKANVSESFAIDVCGVQRLKLRNITIYVQVKSLSNLQRQVVFEGELTVFNCLDHDMSLRFVVIDPKAVENNKQKEIKTLVKASSIVSYVISTECFDMYLSLRDDSEGMHWSRCMEINKNEQSQVVKVPSVDGKMQNIWLQSVKKSYFTSEPSMSVLLCPSYIVHNSLPCPLMKNVSREYETKIVLYGKGLETQLFDELYLNDSLQFSLDTGEDSFSDSNKLTVVNKGNAISNKCLDSENLKQLYNDLTSKAKENWPFSNTSDVEIVKLLHENINLEHYSFSPQIPNPKILVETNQKWKGSNTVLVNVKPWALFINTLDIDLVLTSDNGVEMKLLRKSVLIPPTLENYFRIGYLVKNELISTSQLWMLEKERTKQVQIEGSVPPFGSISIVIPIQKDKRVLVFLLKSEIHNGIRVLMLLPLLQIKNNSQVNFHLSAHAVPLNSKQVLPSQQNITVSLAETNANLLLPLLFWEVAEIQGINSSVSNSMPFEFCISLCMCISTNHSWSRHLWLSPDLQENKRHTLSIPDLANQTISSLPLIISSHKKHGVMFLFISIDPSPFLLLHNQSNLLLCYGQNYTDSKNVTAFEELEKNILLPSLPPATSSYYTFPSMQEQYPVCLDLLPKLHLGFQENTSSKCVWSVPIDVSYPTQFVFIPDVCHLRINRKRIGQTINLYIDVVNKIDFTPKEVRSRIGVSHSTLLSVASLNYSESSESTETNAKSAQLSTIEDADSSVAKTPALCLTLRVMDISFVVCDELNVCTMYSEVLRVNVNDALLFSRTRQTINLTDQMQEVCLCFKSIQIDNQIEREANACYDFPVILKEETPSETSNHNEAFFPNKAKEKAFLVVELLFDITMVPRKLSLQAVNITARPMSLFLEDVMCYKMTQIYESYVSLSLCNADPQVSSLPLDINYLSTAFVNPVRLKHLKINIGDVYLTVHASMKLYLSLERSVLKFQPFEREEIFTNFYELGRITVIHYLTGALFRAGWVVGSLDLLGNPANFARAVGMGITDFVRLPYYGLLNGPRAFLTGLSHGTTSLFSGISSGAITCVTNLATSISRNMDFLSLDSEHLARQEELRRQLPSGVAGGLLQGFSGFLLSLLSAIAGVADHPLQVMVSPSSPLNTAKDIVSGFAKGLIGVVTKPVGGAAEFISQTGHGLLRGAGWLDQPRRLYEPFTVSIRDLNNSSLKFQSKITQTSALGTILFFIDSTHVDATGHFKGNTLLLTSHILCMLNLEEDTHKQTFSLTDIKCEESKRDKNTVLVIHSETPGDLILQESCTVNDRVVDYVKKTWFSESEVKDIRVNAHELQLSPDFHKAYIPSATIHFVQPNLRNVFLHLFNSARRKLQKKGFATNC